MAADMHDIDESNHSTNIKTLKSGYLPTLLASQVVPISHVYAVTFSNEGEEKRRREKKSPSI
jgi:hypothetical protein